MFKLLASAYLIILIPYFTTMLTMELVVNSGILADSYGMTDGRLFMVITIAVFIVEQLAATALAKRFIWRK